MTLHRIISVSLFAFHLSLVPLLAQDVYNQASEQFELGNFEEVDAILSGRVDKLDNQHRVQAYRLLAVSALKQDCPEVAEEYVAKLLAADPFYTAYDADPRFTEILDRLKKGKAKITTASWQEESLEEAPVPMTLITEEMIRAAGARTLGDVLLLYVPGMSRIGGIEENVAMRGVSGLTQETVLVLENGNRLNSQSTNAQPMDYRINLDKVKQIEVLRGPASSLYGSVALTAVVNVITKTGAQMDGGEATAHAGSFSQYGGSLVYGKGNHHSDIFGWVSVYNAKGEAYESEGTTHFIGGYNGQPTYDLGINARWGDFKMSITGKHAKPVPYNNLIGLGNFTYDDYANLEGEKAGMSRTNLRADMSYSHKWDNFGIYASAFGSYERQQLYNVVGDRSPITLSAMLASMIDKTATSIDSTGLFQAMRWSDYCLGGTLSGMYNYSLGGVGQGSVIAGFQYECFMPSYGEMLMGKEFDKVKSHAITILEDGNEHTISGYLQLKHRFSPHLILNGGLRYDHRIQFDDNNIRKFSPRLSLIWLAGRRLSLKAGYSHSFVDAPYLYRASKVTLFRGENLRPESMNSFQIGGTLNLMPSLAEKGGDRQFTYEVNLFYNMVSDLVYFGNMETTGSSASPNMSLLNNLKRSTIVAMLNNQLSGGLFTNAGSIDMGGVEQTLQYTSPRFMASLNLTCQHPFNVETYNAPSAHELANVPKFIGNLVTSWEFLSTPKAGDFWVRMNLHTQSQYHNTYIRIEDALSPYLPLISTTQNSAAGETLSAEEMAALVSMYLNPYKMPYEKQPFQAVLGAGLEWHSPWKLNGENHRLSLALDFYNITNTRYYTGGITRSAIPQQGFSFMGTARVRF